MRNIVILVVGPPAIGKTSLVARIIGGAYSSEYKPTIGVAIHNLTTMVDGKRVEIELVDIPGHVPSSPGDTAAEGCAAYFSRADALIVLGSAISLYRRHGRPAIHCASKCDRPRRQNTWGIATSAVTGNGCATAFGAAVRAAMAFMPQPRTLVQKSPPLVVYIVEVVLKGIPATFVHYDLGHTMIYSESPRMLRIRATVVEVCKNTPYALKTWNAEMFVACDAETPLALYTSSYKRACEAAEVYGGPLLAVEPNEEVRSVRIHAKSKPENGEPENGEPESGKPESGEPESGEPESGEPENGEPESGKPENGEPENGEPESGEPESGEPESGEPGSGEPESGSL